MGLWIREEAPRVEQIVKVRMGDDFELQVSATIGLSPIKKLDVLRKAQRWLAEIVTQLEADNPLA